MLPVDFLTYYFSTRGCLLSMSFFSFERQPVIVIFWHNLARNSLNLIPKMVKVTLRVHYETLNCS